MITELSEARVRKEFNFFHGTKVSNVSSEVIPQSVGDPL